MSKRPKISEAQQDSIDRFLAVVLPRFPTLDPAAEAAVDRMTRIVKHLDKLSGRLSARFGMNVGEFKVLLKLDRHGAMTAGELADVLSLSSGATTNRLDGLEEAGYLTRTRDPEDRRSVLVDVTAAGRDVLERSSRRRAARSATCWPCSAPPTTTASTSCCGRSCARSTAPTSPTLTRPREGRQITRYVARSSCTCGTTFSTYMPPVHPGHQLDALIARAVVIGRAHARSERTMAP